MNHQGSSFVAGCAPFIDLIFFAKTADDLVEKDKENSAFFFMDQDDWVKYDQIVHWPAISMATIGSGDGRYLLAIGPEGDFWELENGSQTDMLGRVSGDDVNARALAMVDQDIYAIGMDRLVLRREGKNRWRSMGPRQATETEGVIGFEDMDGYSKNEMYAVGWQGEIWWYDKTKWRQIDSPVSGNLNAVHCGEDGGVYVVGDNGVMLRGRHDAWEVLDSGRDENLMDVCCFGNTVYVATDFRILRLSNEKLVAEDRFSDPGDLPNTCLYLFKAQDGVVSMGPKDLFRLREGVWERLV